MASNNRRTQQRGAAKDAEGRTEAAVTHRAPHSAGTSTSVYAKRRVDARKVQETLNDMFINVFDAEIIQSVAHGCGWKLNKSIEALIMMSEGHQSSEITSKSHNHVEYSASPEKSLNTASKLSSSDNVDGSCGNILFSSGADTSNSSPVKKKSPKKLLSQNIKFVQSDKGVIKVAYKKSKLLHRNTSDVADSAATDSGGGGGDANNDDDDDDDDDADVVIEEENEFEVTNSVSFPGTSQSVCQFLMPTVNNNSFVLDSSIVTEIKEMQLSPVKKNKLTKKSKTPSQTSSPAHNSSRKTEKKSVSKFEKIKKQILDGIKVMVILRGCPGSGKSTLAKQIIKATHGSNYQKFIFSTDQYFMKTGKYNFIPKFLNNAHLWNQQRVQTEARKGTNPIIIDNTNIEAWEMEPYVKVAVEYGYSLELLEPKTLWKNNPIELACKNIHNVPLKNIQSMLVRFDHELTPAKLLSIFKLKYDPSKQPPQRSFQPLLSPCTTQKKSKVIKENKKTNMNLNKPSSQVKKVNKAVCTTRVLEDEERKSLHIMQMLKAFQFGSKEHVNTVCVDSDLPIERTEDNLEKTNDKLSKGGNLIALSKDNVKIAERVYKDDLAFAVAGTSLPQPLDLIDDHLSDNSNDEFSLSGESDESVSDSLLLNEYEYETNCEKSDDASDIEEEFDKTIIENPVADNLNNHKNVYQYNSCMEYVLVQDDGTMVPQKSFTDNTGVGDAEEIMRTWEYVLLTDNNKLMFHHTGDYSSTKNDTLRENIETDLENSGKPSVSYTERERNTENDIEESTVKDIFSITVSVKSKVNEDKNETSPLLTVYDEPLISTEEEKHNDISTNTVDEVILHSSDLISSCTVEDHLPKFLGKVCDPHLECINEQESDINSTTELTMDIDSNSEDCRESSSNDKELNEKDLDFPFNLKCRIPTYSDQSKAFIKNSVINHEGLKRVDHECPSEISVSDTLYTCSTSTEDENCVSETDTVSEESRLLKKWECGQVWGEVEESVTKDNEKSVDISVPKPARQTRRQQENKTIPIQTNYIENNILRDNSMDTEIIDEWSAVSEPVESWEKDTKMKHDSLKAQNEISRKSLSPQPQRRMFSSNEGNTHVENSKHTCDVSVNNTEISKQKDSCSIYHADFSKNNDSNERYSPDSKEHMLVTTMSTEIRPDDSLRMFIQTKTNKKDWSSAVDLIEKGHFLDESTAHISYVDSCGQAVSGQGSSICERALTGNSIICADASTNTHHADFIYSDNISLGSDVNISGVKIIDATSRDITNEVNMSTPIHNQQRKQRAVMLDKSSMTVDLEDALELSVRPKDQLAELVQMFPFCSLDDLKEIYERCNKDINWTVDLLLESENQGIKLSSSNLINGEFSSSAASHDHNHSSNLRKSSYDASNSYEENCMSPSFMSTFKENQAKLLVVPKKNGKKDRNAPKSDFCLQLKKQLEENIVISDEHYSEHVSRIRKLRHNELDPSGNSSDSPYLMDGNINELTEESDFLSRQEAYSQQVANNSIPSWQPGMTPFETVLRPDAPEWEVVEVEKNINYQNEEGGENEEDESIVSLKMDKDFLEQLHNLFGTASYTFNEGMRPSIGIPLSLARQLHYYVLEAEQNTYDLMMQEDEELARKLQEEENKTDNSSHDNAPDFREIMDMEMALALYNADQKKDGAEKDDDLATKLTKDLLCDWFPSVPRDALMNVFEAHNNSLHQTLEVLLASTNEETSVRTVMSPEAMVKHEKALIERASIESKKDTYYNKVVIDKEKTKEEAMQNVDYYRAEANRHHVLRSECQQKAHAAYTKGMSAVASYYSQVASLHKKRIECNNSLAASSLLVAHTLGNPSTTLDLHYLHVAEALQALDMFVDYHLRKLLGSGHRCKQIFIITGRGARSSGGRSRIKPAVEQRLDERGLRYMEGNPGFLKVIISRSAMLSTCIGH